MHLLNYGQDFPQLNRAWEGLCSVIGRASSKFSGGELKSIHWGIMARMTKKRDILLKLFSACRLKKFIFLQS